MAMSFDNAELAVPELCWLGTLPSDLDCFNVPLSRRKAIRDGDIRLAQVGVWVCMAFCCVCPETD
jgi:hypothetical protein